MSDQLDLFTEKSKLQIAITGASGMVGVYLQAFLQEKGHTVFPIPRKTLKDIGQLQQVLALVDVVINLAGDNIGEGNWSAQKKKSIYDSRILSTRNLVGALNSLPEKVLVSVSAVGYYGGNSGMVNSEEESPGSDFLASVCTYWEKEAKLYNKGRVIIPRFGVVLSKSGGMLKKMLALGKFCLLGKVASGNQKISYISLEDLARAMLFCIEQKTLDGPINFTAPNSISNKELTSIIGKKLHRSTLFPLPKFLVELLFGEKGKALMLADQSVYPKRLLDLGFRFTHPSVGDCI